MNNAAGYPAREKRGRAGKTIAFLLCFISGFSLIIAGFLGAVVYRVRDEQLFQAGIDQYIVAYGILNQSDADAFVSETMDYLNGVTVVWQPTLTYRGHTLVIPQTFAQHMATVRQALRQADALLPLVAIGALLLSALCLLLGRRKAARRGYYSGAVLALLSLAGLLAWGALDFNGFWSWLHYTFIPDGIFNIATEVMQLFPQALFADYIQPVGLAFALVIAAVMLWAPVILGLRWLTGRDRSRIKKGV